MFRRTRLTCTRLDVLSSLLVKLFLRPYRWRCSRSLLGCTHPLNPCDRVEDTFLKQFHWLGVVTLRQQPFIYYYFFFLSFSFSWCIYVLIKLYRSRHIYSGIWRAGLTRKGGCELFEWSLEEYPTNKPANRLGIPNDLLQSTKECPSARFNLIGTTRTSNSLPEATAGSLMYILCNLFACFLPKKKEVDFHFNIEVHF